MVLSVCFMFICAFALVGCSSKNTGHGMLKTANRDFCWRWNNMYGVIWETVCGAVGGTVIGIVRNLFKKDKKKKLSVFRT